MPTAAAPSCTVAGEEVDTGTEAKCFADYMRIHTLEGTGGKTYAQMPRFATEDGAGTNEADQAQKNPDGSPMSNPARQIWVTETALVRSHRRATARRAAGEPSKATRIRFHISRPPD